MTEKTLPRIEFGTDGIRGIAGEYPLDPETVLRIGRAIGRFLQASKDGHAEPNTPSVLIGRDTRMSGHLLTSALSAGLLAEGIEVIDKRVISTPGVAYLVPIRQVDLGIVISASHNPVEQNGIKVFGPDGFKLNDEAEHQIEALIETIRVQDVVSAFGNYRLFHDHLSPYEVDLTKACQDTRLDNLRIALDCANGAASEIAPVTFVRAGVSHLVSLNAEPNGANINLNAGSEFVRRDRSALLATMREHQSDLGIAFDGDADRVVFVTPEGMLVDGDHLLGILALEMKSQGRLPGDTVVATDMSNSGLEHFLKTHGIGLSRTKVGDRYVMERMRQNDFALGGEQAGHIIILEKDRTSGDGIYVGLLVAAIVSRNKQNGGPTLHELASRIPRYPQVIASAHLRGRVDLAQVDGLEALKAETLAAFDNKGRVNIRFSGTEPNLLRAMVEGGPDTSMRQVVERSIMLCTLVAKATNMTRPVIDLVDCATGAPIIV